MSPEYLPIVDRDGNVTGRELRSVCHNGISMLLHPVVHLHIINDAGELYLQKRPMHKDIQPGRWDTSVGGHVDPGETIIEALRREVMEEVGLELADQKHIATYLWESTMERELVHSYIMRTEKMPKPDKEEVDEGRFWTMEEIQNSLGRGVFTPNFEYEFGNL
jgi:isopentenyldiphosphate isomerase